MTHPYQDLKEAAVERMARAWASIDGKADKFELCKRDRAAEDKMGHYLGYLSDAEELAKRSGILSILADYERMREALERVKMITQDSTYRACVVANDIARAALKDNP